MDARQSLPNSFSSVPAMQLPNGEPQALDEQARFEIIMKHGHRDLVQAVAFNAYGDRCATGSVDGEVRVFNRHRDGVWKFCDSWMAHGGEVLELQWLPPTIYPNLLASLGFDGMFKLWVEDPAAAPGRRFGQRSKTDASAAYETRSTNSAYRSFSLKHDDNTRHTFLALLAADGTLTVLENEVPENLSDYTDVDEFRVCAKPARGEEASFRVCFDPNPDPCYTALRAGMAPDTLSLVVAAMDTVKIYRSRPIATTAYGLEGQGLAFYQAAEIKGHRGLVRDVAWAPGNFRGYDILATACQDGYVRVVRLETPFSAADDGKTWAAADMLPKATDLPDSSSNNNNNNYNTGNGNGTTRRRRDTRQSVTSLLSAATTSHSSPSLVGAGSTSPAAAPGPSTGPHAASTPVSVSSSLSSTTRDATAAEGAPENSAGGAGSAGSAAASDVPTSANTSFGSGLSTIPDSSPGSTGGGGGVGGGVSGIGNGIGSGIGISSGIGGGVVQGRGQLAADRRFTGGAGEVRHTVREVCRLENDRTPVWRVSFDDDGQILGSVGDDGKLMCYRQKPDGVWARSSELTVTKTRKVAP